MLCLEAGESSPALRHDLTPLPEIAYSECSCALIDTAIPDFNYLLFHLPHPEKNITENQAWKSIYILKVQF